MATKSNTIVKSGGKEYSYYRLTKTVGHELKDGKKIPVKKQFTGTSKKDAEAKYNKWLEERYKLPTIDSSKSFSELAEYYIENILMINSKYSIGTRILYSNSYKTHLKNCALKHRAITDLNTSDIQELYNSLNITNSALETLHKFMLGFFYWAMHNGYSSNVMAGVVMPEKKVIKKQEKIQVWTDDEINTIINSEPEYVLKPFVLFAIYTGMRISEILGLKWEDIEENIIHVKRQYYRGNWAVPKEGKTRDIPLHPELKKIVDAITTKEDLIFQTASGNPLDYKNVNRSLDRFYTRIGLEHKKFHAYRATFCTNLCKKGVPIQIASKLMGHENIMVTAKYYTSVDSEQMYDAVSKL